MNEQRQSNTYTHWGFSKDYRTWQSVWIQKIYRPYDHFIIKMYLLLLSNIMQKLMKKNSSMGSKILNSKKILQFDSSYVNILSLTPSLNETLKSCKSLKNSIQGFRSYSIIKGFCNVNCRICQIHEPKNSATINNLHFRQTATKTNDSIFQKL